MYRILGSLAAACNDRFTTLQLPAAIRIDSGRRLLVLPRYDGDDLAARWSDRRRCPAPRHAGRHHRRDPGRPGRHRHHARDRRSGAVGDPRPGLPPRRGSHPVSGHRPPAHPGRAAVRRGLRQGRAANSPPPAHADDREQRRLLSEKPDCPAGRPDRDRRLGDLEPGSPFHTIDHPENVAAVFYVHMWGNPAWQAAYRAALSARFAFSPASFARGVVIAALELAGMWLNGTDRRLAAIQASIITSTLAQTPDR